MIKRISFFPSFLLSIFFLWGCSSPECPSKTKEWNQENGRIKVLTTIAMIDDIVKEIGGDKIDTIPLIKSDLDPHSYELVKGDDEKFARADLIFYNGLGLEHGLSLRQNLEKNVKATAVSAPLLKSEPFLLLIVDGQIDPHIWMDISLWVRTIDPIVDALSQKDSLHAAIYKERGEKLKLRMLAADEKAYQTLQAIPQENRYLITSHDAFHYFTRRYLATPKEVVESKWDVRCVAPEGLAPDAQLSVTDLQKIIEHIVLYHVSVLFPEANVSKDSLRKIVLAAQDKGINVRLCKDKLYGDSMGNDGYLMMVHHNVEVISRELNQERK